LERSVKFKSVLIVTYGRSGSTLLQGVLNAIPGFLIRGENYDFCHGLYLSWKALVNAKRRFGDETSIHPDSAWFGAGLLDPDGFLDAARLALIKQLQIPNSGEVRVFGFKEIRYLGHLSDLEGYLNFLAQLLPDLAIIFNTRNHDQVCESGFWKKADRTQLKEKLASADAAFYSYAEKHENSFVMRYENLVRGPAFCEPLFRFLGVTVDPNELLKVLSKPHSYGQDPSTLRKGDELRATFLQPPKQSASPPPLTLFCIQKNEALRLPYFLTYYRRLGCSRFVIVDNESTDGSFEYLKEQDDVCLYQAPATHFHDSRSGRTWINALARHHAPNEWALCADADELLMWPGYAEEGVNGLLWRAERLGLNRVFTPMIDAYSEHAAVDMSEYLPGEPLLEVCPWVDPPSSYRGFWNKGRLFIYGGPRSRLGLPGKPGPVMSKQNLWRVDPSQDFFNGCHADYYGHPSPLVAILLHFKFLPDFSKKTQQAINEKQHWNNAQEYKDYAAANLNAISFKTQQSVKISNDKNLSGHIRGFTRVIRDAKVDGSGHLSRLFEAPPIRDLSSFPELRLIKGAKWR
jgi:hypothetical protein